eukprot:m.27005 g.27005  ORF g.27005 m.27005 type:complete len:50 (+) comp29647_c0_seq1:301-450(+)
MHNKFIQYHKATVICSSTKKTNTNFYVYVVKCLLYTEYFINFERSFRDK